MYKKIYKTMSAIALVALTFGSFAKVSASSATAPQMAATTYYVSTTGNDASAGTSAAPFKTIQKCLDRVLAGDTCQVLNGTYNEALTLKVTGTTSARITLKCATSKGCTVNSGAARTLVAPPGQKGYYTIDGFRFISSMNGNTIDFAYNYWGEGHTAEKGNDGFILKNCYVEGAVYIYGSNNIIENCELNGRGVIENGLTERSQPSENNIFRNNVIHDYFKRGGWSLQMTTNTSWEGNTLYNLGKNGGGSGIDCDGAGIAVNSCNIRNNTFYNISGESAIMLENCFSCIVEGNIIRDSIRGISAINYNKENGDGFRADQDYKAMVTNTIIKNNVIYNMSSDGVLCKAVKGNQLLNNTFYNIKATAGYFGAIGLASYTKVYCPDWVIKGNLVAQSPKSIFYEGNPAATFDGNFYDTSFSASIYGSSSKNFSGWQAMGKDLKSKTGSPLFVNAATGDFRLQAGSPACSVNGTYAGAFPCSGSSSSAPSTSTATAVTASVSPTSTVAVQPSVTPTASSIPGSPTSTASSVPASPTSTVAAQPSATASSVPASPTPRPATATASPVPVLPTATSVPPTSIPPTATAQQSLPASETTYDDKHSSFVYSSEWNDVSRPQSSNGSFKKTTEPGSTVKFTFTGQSFSIIYTAGPKMGKVNVYIDNVLVGTIIQTGNATVYQKRWDYTGQLTAGTHALKLVANGEGNPNGSIDAVIVR